MRVKKINTVIVFAVILTGSICSLSACKNSALGEGAKSEEEESVLTADQRLRNVADRHASLVLRVSPEWATQLGVSEDIGGPSFDERLSLYDKKSNDDLYRMSDQMLQELSAIDRDQLSSQSAVTYDVLSASYGFAQQQNKFRTGSPSVLGANPPYAVNQLFGPQIDLPRLFTVQHSVRSKEDAEAFLVRLGELDRVLDELAAMTEADADKGVTPPVFALEAIVDAAESFIRSTPKSHLIATSFENKLNAVQSMSDDQRRLFNERAVSTLVDEVYPAYRQFADRISALKAHAKDGAGLWRLADGKEMYQVALNAWGANGLTPDEIHQIGLDDVARIHRQMDEILKSVGYDDGSVGQRMAALAKDPTYIISNTDEAKAELVAKLQGDVDNVIKLAPQWFVGVPDYKVEVRRIPVHEQDVASGGYYTPPSLDGERPGIFWINLKDTADTPIYTLKSLVYHEAVPGHHFQAANAMSITDLPLIQNMMWFGDYGEGWALYAEELAKEMGLYEGDALGDLGRLRMELYRAARLVVDTGLHDKRWSREKAIAYMVGVTGESRESIRREIERYAVWPGQAASYKLGMIQFQRLRKLAEDELGEQLDIRNFHDVVLREGAMPMVVLDSRVKNWIAQQKDDIK